MDLNVYPDFDIDAELARAEASVSYHEAQADYFRAQIKHLRKAKDEQMELQRQYEVGDFADPEGMFITDDLMLAHLDGAPGPSVRHTGFDVASEMVERDLEEGHDLQP